MKLNRKWLMVLALVMSLAMATTGTLAYLTDRDSEANVFTMGNVEIDLNEEFEQGSELIPGVDIEKKPTITNTGKNDAWVWATIAIPSALDDDDASKNVVHFNYSKDDAYADVWDWKVDGAWNVKKEVDIDGVEYNVYTVLYKEILEPGDTTTYPVIYKVYMDKHVDIDPEGNLNKVDNGEVTAIDWNINEDGNPVIYVSAYAIQAEGFETVQDAWKAYNDQWGDKGTEYEVPSDGETDKPTNGDDESVTYEVPANAYKVENADELAEAVAAGETTLLLAAGEYDIYGCGGKTLTLVGEDLEKTIITVVGGAQGEANGQLDYGFDSSTVTFQNLTIKTNNNTYAGYARLNGTYKNVNFENHYSLNGTSEFEYCTFNVSGDQYNFWTWGAPTATFDHCTFNSDGKAAMLYGTANTTLTMNNCVFNDTGVLPDLKAAIEVGNDYNKSYKLVCNNVDVNGYEINDKGINTGSTLWANKNSMGTDKLDVVIDGVDVY